MKTMVIGTLSWLLLALTGCQTYHLQSAWTDQPPRIDGQLNDWDSGRFRDLGNRAMEVMAVNDSRYLYMAGRITDPEISRFLAMFGLTLWIDPHGGKRERVELRIPAAAATVFDAARGGFRESLTAAEQTRVDSRLDTLRHGVMVQNGADDQYRVLPAGDAEFQVGVARGDDGGALYEIRIPLVFQTNFLSYRLPERNRPVGLGFGITSMRSMEEQPRGMAGGFPGDMTGGRSFMAKDEVWAEVTLAQR